MGVSAAAVLAELLFGFTSTAPAPALTLAVLVNAPVAVAETVPPIVMVRALPAPAVKAAPVNETLLPALALVPQLPAPATTQLTFETAIVFGTASAILKPVASDGPALLTVKVY